MTLIILLQEEMRDTNESTNSRVLYFSIFSMCCLLGLATWQVSYYCHYFISVSSPTLVLLAGSLSPEVFQVKETH